jgi:hypothetical protein
MYNISIKTTMSKLNSSKYTSKEKKLLYKGEEMDENRRLLGLDCEGEKMVQNRLERKEKEFLKREFNIGYHVVEGK